MGGSRSAAVTDARLSRALVIEAESYGLEPLSFPAEGNVFEGAAVEQRLREILMALEESDLGSFTHPVLQVREGDSGGKEVVLLLRDYRSGGLVEAPEVLEVVPEDSRFEGWAGVLLVARRFMDMIDSLPRSI